MSTTPPAAGRMVLYDSAVPPLEDGQYTISVSTALGANKWPAGMPTPTDQPRKDAVAEAALTVLVSGPRYRLAPSDVVSVDPPNHATGVDPDQLPHIVLSRQSLPWERQAAGGGPWLALLVLDDSEVVQIGRNHPANEVASGVDSKELCDFVQISTAVRDAVLPSQSDLNLLCHVRQVNMTDRGSGATNGDGCFAVVVGNRLANPTSGTLTRACLISLEHPLRNVPGPGSNKPDTVLAVLLYDWSFTTGPVISFVGLMDNLLARGSRSVNPPAALGISAAKPITLPYTDRTGTSGRLSYRSPLSGAPPQAGPAVQADLSLMSARELGRLLAAADRTLVRAVSDWQRTELLGQSTAPPVPAHRTRTAEARVTIAERMAIGATQLSTALIRLAQPSESGRGPAPSDPSSRAQPPVLPNAAGAGLGSRS